MKKALGRPRHQWVDEKFQLVKNQCGRHKLSDIALMLDVPKSSLFMRLKEEGITFSNTPTMLLCKFCEMKEKVEELKTDKLLHLIKVNSEKDTFECSFCDNSSHEKVVVLEHIRSKHKKEVKIANEKSQINQNCNDSACKKLYGTHHKKKWCEKCLASIPTKPKKEASVCPDCGKSIVNLASHISSVHSKENFRCDICSSEFPTLYGMEAHKKCVHEKLPCTECGKLVGVKHMKRHKLSAHAPDDQKPFKCNRCGKGFITKMYLSDHINVHTGEKPYNCQYCSQSFASRGTHAMHERSHLGRGREKYK